jgi:hypothetical protein
VIAAALAGGRKKAARRKSVTGPRPAQVDDGGKILPPLRRGGRDAMTLDRARDLSIQESRGHFDGVTRHDAGVERVEPA